jgi:hypothetical protein
MALNTSYRQKKFSDLGHKTLKSLMNDGNLLPKITNSRIEVYYFQTYEFMLL